MADSASGDNWPVERPLRVLLVDDHPMILAGLANLLSAESDLELVGEATSVETALAAARSVRPDLVVLPVRLGGRTAGIDLCRRVKATTSARTLVYTAFTESADVEAAVSAGADGFVGKTAAAEDIVRAIRAIQRGRRVWLPASASVGRSCPRSVMPDVLTAREREVLALLLERMTNQEIAVELSIAVTTVKSHVRSVLVKLGAASRRDLFRASREHRDGDRLSADGRADRGERRPLC
jgi:DNA-binding NarL/FixJ family response regulator